MSVPVASNASVLLITNDFGPRAGGIETFIHGLLERMPHGSCIVYTSSQEGNEEFDQKWLTHFGVEVVRDRSKILLPTPRVAKKIKEILSTRNISHIWYGAAAPLGLLNPALKRYQSNSSTPSPSLRTVALTHGHEVWWAKIPPFSLVFRGIASSLDQIGYLTTYTRNEISKGISERDRSKLRQIAPGIDINHFRQSPDIEFEKNFRHRYGVENKRLIISVGRLVHRKGQDRLIEALPKILDEIPDAHLLLVGEGPHRRKLDRIASRLKVQSAITFLGRLHLDELPKHLSLAEIFAMPSRNRLAGLEVEGLGIVYLEASSCALPVIAGRSGGAVDALIDGETGLLVDGTKVDEIATACIQLMKEKEFSTGLGKRGSEWVREQWSWDRWSAEFQTALLG
jgi:phosphatidylinositol alpha-1,6-mannosyltransferase